MSENFDGEDWEGLQDKPIRTVGSAHMEITCDIEGFDPMILASVFGLENYLGDDGSHRVKDITLWEYKTFDQPRGFIFNKPRYPLCPSGLGRA